MSRNKTLDLLTAAALQGLTTCLAAHGYGQLAVGPDGGLLEKSHEFLRTLRGQVAMHAAAYGHETLAAMGAGDESLEQLQRLRKENEQLQINAKENGELVLGVMNAVRDVKRKDSRESLVALVERLAFHHEMPKVNVGPLAGSNVLRAGEQLMHAASALLGFAGRRSEGALHAIPEGQVRALERARDAFAEHAGYKKPAQQCRVCEAEYPPSDLRKLGGDLWCDVCLEHAPRADE